ncbi:MAG: hypothetical protein RQ741_02925 [Wenzhouxiangellaceae bacterium]|nr:hypothetical protein [Wenzhouxiangellaceae bacterium]
MNVRRTPQPSRMQGFRDVALAVLLAIAVHLAGLGLLWLGSLSWQPNKPLRAAPAFTLVDAAPYVAAERREQLAEQQERAAQQRLEQAQREQARREAELEQQRRQEQERQTQQQQRQALLEQQRAEQLARESEMAQQRQAEQLRQQQRELREAEQQRRLDELEDLRRQRELAQQEREAQERRLAELAEQREIQAEQRRAEAESERLRLASEQAEQQQREASLRDEYGSTIAELVKRNWIRPGNTRPGVRCNVRVVQIPGGEIIDSAIASPCNADELTRRSIIAAVERTAVLPYRGYEDVFEREIVFTFVYDG